MAESTELWEVCEDGDADQVQQLLDKKADPNQTGGRINPTFSPLMHAASGMLETKGKGKGSSGGKGNYPKVVEALLSAKADASFSASDGPSKGVTALFLAAVSGVDPPVAKMLLQAGADPGAFITGSSDTGMSAMEGALMMTVKGKGKGKGKHWHEIACDMLAARPDTKVRSGSLPALNFALDFLERDTKAEDDENMQALIAAYVKGGGDIEATHNECTLLQVAERRRFTHVADFIREEVAKKAPATGKGMGGYVADCPAVPAAPPNKDLPIPGIYRSDKEFDPHYDGENKHSYQMCIDASGFCSWHAIPHDGESMRMSDLSHQSFRVSAGAEAPLLGFGRCEPQEGEPCDFFHGEKQCKYTPLFVSARAKEKHDLLGMQIFEDGHLQLNMNHNRYDFYPSAEDNDKRSASEAKSRHYPYTLVTYAGEPLQRSGHTLAKGEKGLVISHGEDGLEIRWPGVGKLRGISPEHILPKL